MRIKSAVNPRIFEDAALLNALFALDSESEEQTFDGCTQYGVVDFKRTDATEVTLVTGISAKGMFLRADGNLNLKINGAAVALPVRKVDTVAGRKTKVYLDGTITSVAIANANGDTPLTTLNGKLVYWY
jgi:hypothetical protein